jgi:hypothetical protein
MLERHTFRTAEHRINPPLRLFEKFRPAAPLFQIRDLQAIEETFAEQFLNVI